MRRSSTTVGALATVTCAGVSACAPDTVPSHVTVRDSAGVEIVESTGPAWGESEAWVVDPRPLVRIGVVEGEDPYQMSNVAGVLRLDDGTVVVADAGSSEVRFFDSEGRYRTSVGGPGEGPGEFASITALGRGSGGRIWAYDFGTRRITWLERTGRIVAMATLDPEPAALHPIGTVPGGGFVLRQLWGAEQTAEGSHTGFRRDPVAFVRFDGNGALVDTVTMVPGRETYLREEDGRGVMITPLVGRNAVGAVLPRATSTGTAASGGSGEPDDSEGGNRGTLVVGDQTTFELRELTPAGKSLRVIRLPDRDLSVDPAEVERMLDAWVETVPEEARPGLRATMESQPLPETMPAYGGIQVDPAGRLWVSEWSRPPTLPQSWTVLATDGAWLGDVDVPPGFYPYDIGDDWMAGVETDEMDIEYVVVYSLVKAR